MICLILFDGRDLVFKKIEGRNKKIRKKSDLMIKYNFWLKNILI